MLRPNMLSSNERACIALFLVAGVLARLGRHLYGDRATVALYEQFRTVSSYVDPYTVAMLLLLVIVAAGFALFRFRQLSPVLYGAAGIVFAGFAGGMSVASFAHTALRATDGAALDTATLLAFVSFFGAVFVAVHGWDHLVRGLQARQPAPKPPGPRSMMTSSLPLNGLLTPSAMARASAQLTLQLANYAAAEAAREEARAGAAALEAGSNQQKALEDAAAARAEAREWDAARTAQASAHLAVRKASQA